MHISKQQSIDPLIKGEEQLLIDDRKEPQAQHSDPNLVLNVTPTLFNVRKSKRI